MTKMRVSVAIMALVGLLSGPAMAADAVLTWTAPAVTATKGAATGYRLFKGAGVSACANPAALPLLANTGNVLTATDTGLAEGATACYEVSATNAGGESPRSNRVTVSVPVNPPDAPTLSVVIR